MVFRNKTSIPLETLFKTLRLLAKKNYCPKNRLIYFQFLHSEHSLHLGLLQELKFRLGELFSIYKTVLAKMDRTAIFNYKQRAT